MISEVCWAGMGLGLGVSLIVWGFRWVIGPFQTHFGVSEVCWVGMGSGWGFSLVVWGFRVVILGHFKPMLGLYSAFVQP